MSEGNTSGTAIRTRRGATNVCPLSSASRTRLHLPIFTLTPHPMSSLYTFEEYGLVIQQRLLLAKFDYHPARWDRIAAVYAALPTLDIQRPYNHEADLAQIVEDLVPTLCRLSGKTEPVEFMGRFEAVMDIWDDIPHTNDQGDLLPTLSRREVCTACVLRPGLSHTSLIQKFRCYLLRKHVRAVFTRTQYQYGVRDPEDGPWQDDLDINVHLEKKVSSSLESL